jgi:PIN domain nuclease of toxin-antitoxin system
VKFLTDTNAFLWFITDSPRLGAKAKALLESRDNERLLSVASIWEIAIKASLGKLTFRKPLEEFIPEQIAINDFTILDISVAHALQIARLPFHHRDPFDRMLVAQCLTENLPLVGSDDALDAYGIQRWW